MYVYALSLPSFPFRDTGVVGACLHSEHVTSQEHKEIIKLNYHSCSHSQLMTTESHQLTLHAGFWSVGENQVT